MNPRTLVPTLILSLVGCFPVTMEPAAPYTPEMEAPLKERVDNIKERVRGVLMYDASEDSKDAYRKYVAKCPGQIHDCILEIKRLKKVGIDEGYNSEHVGAVAGLSSVIANYALTEYAHISRATLIEALDLAEKDLTEALDEVVVIRNAREKRAKQVALNEKSAQLERERLEYGKRMGFEEQTPEQNLGRQQAIQADREAREKTEQQTKPVTQPQKEDPSSFWVELAWGHNEPAGAGLAVDRAELEDLSRRPNTTETQRGVQRAIRRANDSLKELCVAKAEFFKVSTPGEYAKRTAHFCDWYAPSYKGDKLERKCVEAFATSCH